MGRRALRKIDPALDLSCYLFPLELLPKPLDAAALFGRPAPMEVEVGSGKGLFLSSMAGSHADRNFLGSELSRKYARYSAARLAKRELANAKVVCGDALWLFRDYLPTGCAQAVHVYFPDPWWKKRHAKRRVMKAEFVRDVERVLIAGGVLHFWTDVREYFERTLQLITSATELGHPLPVSEQPAQNDLDYRTHFERRMRLHDEPVYRAEFRKPPSH